MALSAGDRLGPYEILEPLGAGGMGEVYRARDTRLERDVAIKVLPPGLQESEERRQRFEREARTISRLNHPNICTLHDLGEEDGQHYLVMELLEGESLADRLQKGPLPPHQVLRYGAQVADALHAAHRQGITHRDLKPGNVVLTKSGAKLLDFGLAKPAESEGSVDEPSRLPTAVKPLTEKGSILGTVQYMAPEQLEGLEADARTDIFALGALLHEMATGRRAFEGGSRTSLIAAIVSSQPPPVSTLVPLCPPALDHVVARCLEKDPDDRWQSAHDVAGELRWIDQGRSTSGESGASRRPPVVRASTLRLLAAALIGAIAGLGGGLLVNGRPTETSHELPPLRFVIEHGDLQVGRPALSSDGRRVAYVREGSLWVRDLRQIRPIRIPHTEDANVPFWSPDGEWLGFTSEGRLWKIRLDGSEKTSLCTPAPSSDSGGAAWLPDGRIVFATGGTGLHEVSDRGGTARVVLEPDEDELDFHNASALPGQGILFVVHHGESMDRVDLWDGTDRRTVFRWPGEALGPVSYAATGHLVLWRGGTETGVWAVPFSATRLEATGEPFRVAPFGALPHAGGNGTLAYVPPAPLEVSSQIVVVDRGGQIVHSVGEPRTGLGAPALSPDGRRVAVLVGSVAGVDLWVHELETGDATRLTFSPSFVNGVPAWTPDGDQVIQSWQSAARSALRAHRADGSGAVRELGAGMSPPVFFLPDGHTLVYGRPNEQLYQELWKREYAGEGPGEPLFESAGLMWHLALSPDGRFMVYALDGKVLARSFPDMGGPWEVASGGATSPVWDPRGGRLYYAQGRDVMEVSVTTRPSFRVGAPRRLFEFAFAPSGGNPRFAVTPDGTSFVMLQAQEPVPALVVVQNWLGLAE
jgi:serine/threonine protein kinase/Tol biopolymer transport system component